MLCIFTLYMIFNYRISSRLRLNYFKSPSTQRLNNTDLLIKSDSLTCIPPTQIIFEDVSLILSKTA